MALPGSKLAMKVQRLRFDFSKNEAMRFTGHLDLRLTWERTIRRSGLPLAYSEGYSPKPLFNFALPLPLGFISRAEIGDFWFSETIDKVKAITSIRNSLPPGLSLEKISLVTDLHGNKLPGLVDQVDYQVPLQNYSESLSTKIEQLLETTDIIRIRRKKEYNLRPLIKDLQSVPSKQDQHSVLKMTLTALPGATGRPDEVLSALNLDPLNYLICRTRIHLRNPE